MEGLRKFLRQTSAVSGIINAQFLGVTLSDTTEWFNSHNSWVNKLVGVEWNELETKKITKINWGRAALSSVLDCNYFIKLENLNIYENLITILSLDNCTELTNLTCSKNQLTELDVTKCAKLLNLTCSNNQLTELDVRNFTELEHLICYDNNLLFSQMPLFNSGVYYYSPQRTVKGGEIYYIKWID